MKRPGPMFGLRDIRHEFKNPLPMFGLRYAASWPCRCATCRAFRTRRRLGFRGAARPAAFAIGGKRFTLDDDGAARPV